MASRFASTVLTGILAGILVLATTPVRAAQRTTATPSITLDQSTARLGGTVTFTSVYPSQLKIPEGSRPLLSERQSGLAEARATGEPFVLGGAGSVWLSVGGPASCSAELFYFTYKGGVQKATTLAWDNFEATGI